MLSRVPLRAPARVLSVRHVRSRPIPAAQCCDLDIRPVRRQSVQICRIPRVAVSPFSSSCVLYDTPNNPGKSGDKGPAKNYRKKMRKKRIKAMANAEESDAVLEGTRAIQSLIVGNKMTKPSAEPPTLDSVLEEAKRPIKADQSKVVKKGKKQVATKQDPASILEAIAMGTKVMLDQSKDMEQREGEKVEDATGPALLDALAEEEAKTFESKMTPQNRAKAMKQQREKKQVPMEKQHAPASILEAVAEGAKMMETLLDQSKAAEKRTGGKGDDTVDTVDAITEGYKTIESLLGRPRARGGVGARKERRGGDDLEYPDYMQHFRDSDSGVQTSSSRGFSRRERNMRAMDDRGGPRQRGDGKEYDFTKPGERLGLFHRPKPGSEATPPPHSKPTLAEQDEVNELREFFLLKPTSHFEEQMEGAMTTTVRYPRTFPVDNDDYFKNHKEAFVGFEEHVLLDHLLEGFPKRGPVRHFMELVVTGLSKNPHYTAAEKGQCVEWYKDYFSKFTSSELQSL